MKRMIAAVLGVGLLLGGCTTQPPEQAAYVPPPGVTDTEIVLGSHQPLTGPAAAGYSKVSAATKAYFDYVNANGGVYGRKITYTYADDGYDPAQTQTVVRDLVLSDQVFAIVEGFGTPTHAGVIDFLNDNGVPDLFPASGATMWNNPTKYPETFAYQPNYATEGKIIGSYVKANFAGQTICHFGQADDYGSDSLAGLEKGLGAPVAFKTSYITSNGNVSPQVDALKQAGCQVVVLATIPSFTALTLATAARVGGFSPQWIVSTSGGDYPTIAAQLGASAPLAEGLISTGYLPLSSETENPWVALFAKVDAQFDGDVELDNNVIYGMSVGYTIVQALLAAGEKPTRASLVEGLERHALGGNPSFVPLVFEPDNHAGLTGERLSKVTGGVQSYFGSVYVTDAYDAPITEYTTPAAVPPDSGIPAA